MLGKATTHVMETQVFFLLHSQRFFSSRYVRFKHLPSGFDGFISDRQKQYCTKEIPSLEPQKAQTSPRRNYPQRNADGNSLKSVTNKQTSSSPAKTWHNHMKTTNSNKTDDTFDF